MNPQDIKEIIEILAEKLGPMGTRVWIVLIRQVYLSAIQDIIGGVVATIIGIVATRYGLREWATYKAKKEGDRRYYGSEDMFAFVILAVATVAFFFAFYGFLVAPFRLLNPEYHAIRFLLKSVK